MDLGASAILDRIVVSLQALFASSNANISFSGRYPTDDAVRTMFRSAGLVKSLGIPGAVLPDKKSGQYIFFPLRSGGLKKRQSRISSEHELVASDLAAYFDTCLNTQGFCLSRPGRAKVQKLVAEILINCQEHSSTGIWYVTAYLSQQNSFGECSLAIFNFGDTIYKSLQGAGTQPYIRNKMRDLSNTHIKGGLFGTKWTEEVLWTLYSLQEGVSRHKGVPAGDDRGNGTIDMIRFFMSLGKQAAGNEKPKMTLISGRACILFDGSYDLQNVAIDGEQRRVIAFNKDNDLAKQPDHKYVRKLDTYFPGTIISMKFFLDKAYYQRVLKPGESKEKPAKEDEH